MMSGLGKVLAFAASPLAATIGAVSKTKAKPMLMQPVATPRANSVVADALAARRGAAANQRTGAGGAESNTGKKVLLGS